MDSRPTSLPPSPATLDLDEGKSHSGNIVVVFDPSVLQKQPKIPEAFIWPRCERPHRPEELEVPVVDLKGFLEGDAASTSRTAAAIRGACASHGFFQVMNHKVDAAALHDALRVAEEFFELPLSTKLRARRRPGSTWGYVGAHADRFASMLPWKETLSFAYDYSGNRDGVVDYITSKLGEEFRPMGYHARYLTALLIVSTESCMTTCDRVETCRRVHQRYCTAMKELSLSIMELLGISLGVGRDYYREFFEDGSSIMRCNNYPPCQEPELTLGTGPHSDPTALTILHQDQVAGLQVFAEGNWRSVSPIAGALVINIGDIFMALTNGRYKSCLHRALVNRDRKRRSLAFFVCPQADKVVRPAKELLVGHDGGGGGVPRNYPDFTWAELLEFTQSYYRTDASTLQNFTHRLC
ncbi:gibberellin 20 oxidase [Musa troglodytarum]|uniref:Gibberellin 20 oxidase n=1 Tax=Musa troglodytarum TaxID=320322 RepID=A0A9E7JFY2_9LILI|nr:gibberellin 20 oxidase [Musa troglodytarum]